MQQPQRVQNMLGQKVLQVHQINRRSRQKPWNQCKQVSSPIPINWLIFHLALQTGMLSRHKLFEPLFQQIQHLDYLRTPKCRSFFCLFCTHVAPSVLPLGSPLGEIAEWCCTKCWGEVVEDSQGAICWPCVSHCFGHWSITKLWHSADGWKGATKKNIDSVCVNFDYKVCHIVFVCNWADAGMFTSPFIGDVILPFKFCSSPVTILAEKCPWRPGVFS